MNNQLTNVHNLLQCHYLQYMGRTTEEDDRKLSSLKYFFKSWRPLSKAVHDRRPYMVLIYVLTNKQTPGTDHKAIHTLLDFTEHFLLTPSFI